LTLLLTRTRGSGHATDICGLWTVGRDPLGAHVELDFAPQLDDGFRMVSILDQCEFDGQGAVDEETAIESILLLGDPLAWLFRPMKTMYDKEPHDGGSTIFMRIFL